METSTRQAVQFDQETYIPIWAEAWLVSCRARNLTPRSVDFYREKLGKFLAFCDSLAITQLTQLTPQNVREYLISLENTGHTSGGIHAFYRTLRAFLRWYEDEAEPEDWRNPIRKVKAPKVETEILEPADIDSVYAMLDTCTGKSFSALRDKAILLTLLDTGLRAAELLNLDLADVDTIRGDVLVRQGKGRKPRTVFIGKRTRKALRAYKMVRISSADALFVTDEGERMAYWGLKKVVERRAARAGVKPPSLHSFRRFFALEYLRNGGDIFTLQRLMGHSDLQILRRYLNQIDSDLERGHAQFGPVDRMKGN